MRLVTLADGRLGSETTHGIVDLQRALRSKSGGEHDALRSMLKLIDCGPTGLDIARVAEDFAVESGDAELFESSDVARAAPLPDPRALRCCSVFAGHYVNAHRTISRWRNGKPSGLESPPPGFFANPGYYKGNHLNLTGDRAEIRWPDYAEWLDFELELALVVGRPGINLVDSDWQDHVFGWSIFNDVSARIPLLDEIAQGTGPNKGKDFDSANILGPCIVTADSFDGTAAVGLAWVNGELWGNATSAEMAHGWGRILAHRSRSEALHAGEIITSGAFTGCSGIDHDRPLRRGDEVRLEIEGIGSLTNRVAL